MIKSGNWIKTGNEVFVSLIFLDGTNVKIHQKTEIEIKSSRVTSKELKTNPQPLWIKKENKHN